MRGTSRSPTFARLPTSSRRCEDSVEYNIEGDPRPDLIDLVLAVRPDQCTLVPVMPGEITSQAGWPADTPRDVLTAIVDTRRRPAFASACSSIRSPPRSAGRRASGPIASSCTPSRSRARSNAGPAAADELPARTSRPPSCAHELGLGINAGHDLDLRNLTLFRTLPHLDEVSIGHALISRALFVGLRQAVRDYLRALTPESA